jgi:hypothetical protein
MISPPPRVTGPSPSRLPAVRIAPPSRVSTSAVPKPGSKRSPVTMRTVTAETSGPATCIAPAMTGLLNVMPKV